MLHYYVDLGAAQEKKTVHSWGKVRQKTKEYSKFSRRAPVLWPVDILKYLSDILSLFASTGSSCVSITCNQKNTNEFQNKTKQNKVLYLAKVCMLYIFIILN